MKAKLEKSTKTSDIHIELHRELHSYCKIKFTWSLPKFLHFIFFAIHKAIDKRSASNLVRNEPVLGSAQMRLVRPHQK